jgi:Na+/H+-dicarboxylate symporters
MKPLGDGFIKLIKMVIGPIIFCTVVTGIAGMEDMKKVGRVGGKALLYFEIVSTFALVLGLIATHVLKPGVGFNIDPATLDGKASRRMPRRRTADDGRLPDAHHSGHARCRLRPR